MKTEQKELLGYYRSPLGPLQVRIQNQRITGIECVSSVPAKKKALPSGIQKHLDRYFSGKSDPGSRLRFHSKGTFFQEQVWKELQRIPWGRCVSYADIARTLKRPKAVRAVASAIGKNPIAILVPCHRVIGSDGKLRGYAYGLKKKAWLLNHERRYNHSLNKKHG